MDVAPSAEVLATAEEVAQALRVTKRLIYSLAARGAIPAVRVGRILRFRIHEVVAALQANAAAQQQAPPRAYGPPRALRPHETKTKALAPPAAGSVARFSPSETVRRLRAAAEKVDGQQQRALA